VRRAVVVGAGFAGPAAAVGHDERALAAPVGRLHFAGEHTPAGGRG
jgi:monoamine oxidase